MLKIKMEFDTDNDFGIETFAIQYFKFYEDFSFNVKGGSITMVVEYFYNITDDVVRDQLIEFLDNFPFKTNKDYITDQLRESFADYKVNLKQTGLQCSNSLLGGNYNLNFYIYRIDELYVL